MRCRSVLTRVDAHRTGELVRGEKETLERHLVTCPSCRESRTDVDELAAAMKSLVVAPPRSCREAVRAEVCDSFELVETEAFRARVAFSGNSVRMIDASAGSLDAFRRTYARRFGRELVESPLPDPVRRAVVSALEGRPAKLPSIDLSGTSEFERSVLETLKKIPKGEARTYEWVAAQVGRPRAARAVGNALANNPVPLLLPCHRVLPSTGAVGRYTFGPAMKRSLLEAEGVPLAELEAFGRKGIRFIGSSTTKVFCVPACRDARRIRESNRVPFHDADEALRGGYRACKHCTPVAEVA
jgi:O-6-methylguanine DNA methyltransferase